MTKKQQLQFNTMYLTLRRISKVYQTPDRLRRNSEKQYGLEYEEALEMAYENIQNDASFAVKGVRPIPDQPKNT